MKKNFLILFGICSIIILASFLLPHESKADVNDYWRHYSERSKEHTRQLMNDLKHDEIASRLRRLEERSREIDRLQNENAATSTRRLELMREMGRYDSYFDKGF